MNPSQFIREYSLTQQTPLNKLHGTRIAVEGTHWLKQLSISDPWHMAMGGVPSSLPKAINESLKEFEKYEISPVFIFPGINCNQQQTTADGKPLAFSQNTAYKDYATREAAWDAYKAKDGVALARKYFADTGTDLTSADCVDAVLKHFRQEGIEFMRAPYLASAQAAWFVGQHDHFASALWGSEECLLFLGLVDTDVLIQKIDFAKGAFEWVSLDAITSQLGDGGLTMMQFIDVCILTGMSTEDTPFRGGLLGDGPDGHGRSRGSNFNAVAMELQQTEDGHNLLAKYHSKPEHLELFLQQRDLIVHHIVLNSQCVAIPISSHQPPYHGRRGSVMKLCPPTDLVAAIGPRLPNLVYGFLAWGLISPQVINNVVHNTMIEYLPTIDSKDYRELLQKIVPLRTQIAYLLINCVMMRDRMYWQVQPQGGQRTIMKYIQWWRSEHAIQLHTPPALHLDDWNVTGAREHTGSNVNFVTILPFASHAMKTSGPHGPAAIVYSDFFEAMCVILLKSLDLLGYFTHPPHQRPLGPDPSGKSLYAEALSIVSPQNAEHAVSFIELIRTGALTSAPLQPAPTQAGTPPPRPQELETVQKHCLLISRVFSIIPMELKPEPWTCDIVVRDLTAFHVLFKSLYKTLRNLCEIIMLVMFLDHRIKIPTGDAAALGLFNDFVKRLPFHGNVNTAMGVVIHHMLSVGVPAYFKIRTPEMRWKTLDLEKTFPCCVNIKEDIQHAYGFWCETVRIVEKLREGREGQAIPEELAKEFQDAHVTLQAFMLDFGLR